jgi:hypothetical protein
MSPSTGTSPRPPAGILAAAAIFSRLVARGGVDRQDQTIEVVHFGLVDRQDLVIGCN